MFLFLSRNVESKRVSVCLFFFFFLIRQAGRHMFSSYVLYDTVAIEAVYFPHNFHFTSHPSNIHTSHTTENRDHDHASSSHDEGDDDAPYQLTLRDILLHRLTERYVGRVIPSRGLCVAITEVLEYSASSVRGAAASAWLAATFSVCVFAPTAGTRLTARIAHQNATGVFLTLDLFVSIPFLVPAAMLVPGSRYRAAQRSWYLPLDATADEEAGASSGAGVTEKEETEEGKDGRTSVDGTEGELHGLSSSHSVASGATTAMAAPTVPQNKYIVGAEVIVKVVACTVLSEEAVVAADEAESAGTGAGAGSASVLSFSTLPSAAAGSDVGGPSAREGPQSIMELRGSFIGDALGPVSWFEDA